VPHQFATKTAPKTTTAQKRTFRKSPNAISIPDHPPSLIGIPIAFLFGVYFVPHDSSCQVARDERRGVAGRFSVEVAVEVINQGKK
jgi:hypothetical protein